MGCLVLGIVGVVFVVLANAGIAVHQRIGTGGWIALGLLLTGGYGGYRYYRHQQREGSGGGITVSLLDHPQPPASFPPPPPFALPNQGARPITPPAAVVIPPTTSPSTQPSPPADPEEDVYVRLIERLEAGKGPAARRAVLERGLRQLQAPWRREKLMLEASRIEIEAALEKADRLKTVAAKRRVLEAALADLRQDDVPDELQQRQIEWLEQALRDLPSS